MVYLSKSQFSVFSLLSIWLPAASCNENYKGSNAISSKVITQSIAFSLLPQIHKMYMQDKKKKINLS